MRKYAFLLMMLQGALAMAQQAVTPPYSQTFDTEASMSDFIILDANGDESTWSHNPMMHCARCSFSDTEVSDDYLFLPLQLKAGAAYTMQFTAIGGFYATKYDVWMGDAPTKQGMTRQLLTPLEVNNVNKERINRINFQVEANGVYYIAVHCCSDPTGGTLFIDDLSIDVAEVTTPSAPTDVVLTAGAKGANYCDIQFKLPTTTLDGEELNIIKCAHVYRNDNLVRTITTDAAGQPIEPGATCTWRNTELGNRLYTYKIVAVTEGDEEGAAYIGEVYVGLDSPVGITNLECREDLTRPGTVVVTWDPVTTGKHGGYIDPKSIYYIVSLGYDEEHEVWEPRFEYTVDTSRGQTYSAMSVWAKNYIDSSRDDRKSSSTQVGPSMVAPWSESYPDATVKNGPWLGHVTGATAIGEATWYISSPFSDMPAQDNDGGYVYFSTTTLGKSSRYVSPKVDISQLTSPTLSFWVYERGGQNTMDVDIMPDMTNWTTLRSLTLSGERGWHRYSIDLSSYRTSQCVQIGFNVTSVDHTERVVALDNISIHEDNEYDVCIRTTDFPARVDMAQSADFTITVRNQGTQPLAAGAFTAQLYRKDEQKGETSLVCEQAGPALGLDAVCSITLTDTPDIFASPTLQYYVQLVLTGDKTPNDNITDIHTATVFRPAYPTPTALTAESQDKGVALSWQAPDLSEGSAARVTDTFEDYQAFNIDDCGEWTLHDADGQFTLTMALIGTNGSVILLDEYPHAGEPMAFQVFNPTDAGIPYTSWEPHSDEKMMVAMGNAKNADGTYHPNDDWMISPALSGHAQQISFWAKCGMGSAYQPERLQVLYSTTDREPSSFIPTDAGIIDLYNVSAWEEFVVSLPEGARYFALRCVSQHKFALLIDDVTYQPAGRANLTLLGYNIYRDQQRLNADPLPAPAYFDTDAQMEQRYTYHVSALYDAGESSPAELKVFHSLSGISQIATDEHPSSAHFDLQGRPYAPQAQKGVSIRNGRKLITH